MSVEYGIMSWIGKRKEQQDSVEVYNSRELTIAVLCDGMGGYKGGAQASRIAAESFIKYTKEAYPTSNVRRALANEAVEIDQDVYELKDDDGNQFFGGTTLAGVVIDENELNWLSIGDSRIYVERNGKVACVTRDHNYKLLLDEQIKLGQISHEEYEQNMEKAEHLISFVGCGRVYIMDVNTEAFKLIEQDKILLCSDGVYKSISDEQISDILMRKKSAEDIATDFLDALKKKDTPYQDNASAVVIRFLRDEDQTQILKEKSMSDFAGGK